MPKRAAAASRAVDRHPDFAAAKLLFQWRVLGLPRRRKKRVCEERIVVFRCDSAEDALSRATQYGRDASYTETREGQRLAFEFVGILELLGPGDAFFDPADEFLEVWWEYRELMNPSERKRALIKPAQKLRAFTMGDRRAGRMTVPDATSTHMRKRKR